MLPIICHPDRFCPQWLGGIWRRLRGEPIWTEYHNGEVRKSRMKRTANGVLIVRMTYNWQRVNPDGTADKGYVVKWWPR